MKYQVLTAVLLASLSWSAFAQDLSKLTEVKKIYIGELGREAGSDLVREKLRARLMKSSRFTLVEREELADAILTGVASVAARHHSTVQTDASTGRVSGSGGTSYHGAGVIRLVTVKGEETIWIYEYKRAIMSFGSASSNVAEKTVDRLLKDAKEADKKAANPKP